MGNYLRAHSNCTYRLCGYSWSKLEDTAGQLEFRPIPPLVLQSFDTTEHPEVVVVKEEKLEEELRDCGSKHNQLPRSLSRYHTYQ